MGQVHANFLVVQINHLDKQQQGFRKVNRAFDYEENEPEYSYMNSRMQPVDWRVI